MSCRKVVRRASLSDRTNLYRKECEKEAIVWQQLGAAEEGRNSGLIGEIGETRPDQENTDPVRNLSCLKEFQRRAGSAGPIAVGALGWDVAEKFVNIYYLFIIYYPSDLSKRHIYINRNISLQWKGCLGFTAA